MSKELIALYEIKRQALLLGYIQHPSHIKDSLAFAYYRRIAPIFHQDSDREAHGSDPFEDIYFVKAEFVSSLLRYVDDRSLERDFDALRFTNLEDKFGGYKANRAELIFALEYARIDGRFEQEVWEAIELDAPIEAKQLEATFSPQDVNFY